MARVVLPACLAARPLRVPPALFEPFGAFAGLPVAFRVPARGFLSSSLLRATVLQSEIPRGDVGAGNASGIAKGARKGRPS